MMRLVMYDLDGTLLDTVGEIALAVNLALAEAGAAPVDERQVRGWIGHGAARLIEAVWQATRPGLAVEALMASFSRHYQAVAGQSCQPFPHVLETLADVHARGVKQAVITNKESSFTRQVLARHGMTDWFELIIGGDTLPVRKPDPAVVRHCLATLGQTAEHSLYVGDSEVDIATARAAGVRCWVVPYGYNGGRDIRQAGADRVIDDLRAVTQALRDNQKCEV